MNLTRILRRGVLVQRPVPFTMFLAAILSLSGVREGFAADPIEAALQQGLVAEEAQRDFRAARAAYDEAVRLADARRGTTATALYRLADVERRLGDIEAARTHFERLIREYPEQTALIELARRETVPEGTDPGQRGDDPNQLLRQEIAVAEEALRLVQGRQASREEVLRAQREVLSLKRQLASQPRLLDVVDLDLTVPSKPATNPAPSRRLLTLSEEEVELARLRRLAEESPDLLRRPGPNGTPLQNAASKEWIAVVEFLLDLGVSPDDSSQHTRTTALQRAVSKGNLKLATLLLDRGADVNARGNGSETALHVAARSGHRAVAELLIERGAHLNDPGSTIQHTDSPGNNLEGVSRGNTPLHLAAHHGAPSLVDLLLARGAALEAKNDLGRTPLVIAVVSQQPACVDRLLRAGANSDVMARMPGSEWESTPVQWAAGAGEEAILKMLLDAGSTPRTAYPNGTTPLHLAAAQGHDGSVRVLLKAGANPNARTDDGKTPLDLAPEPIQQTLRDTGGTNAVPPSQRGPNSGVPRQIPAVVRMPQPLGIQHVQGFHPSRTQSGLPARIHGEVFGVIPIEVGSPVRLRRALESLNPPSSADLAHVQLRRMDPASGTQETIELDLTAPEDASPESDPVLQPGDEVLIPPRPRRP
ncbi:MAG: ankyrin repeat domain-containing protein [Verrucomicrobiae bacterium]|nr:ankyrin repeat domain-containing protein [Verrucomicrobiae bacterium]